MNLCIDIGNSYYKTAVFKGKDLVHFKIYKKLLVRDLKLLHIQFGFEKVILSSVRKTIPRFLNYLERTYTTIILNHKTKVPFKNLYSTPKTLGKDRVAAVAGAVMLFPNKNLLIVDIGTCMTLDFVTKNAEYIGGNISPGIHLRLRAMHEFTSSLPLVKKQQPKKLMGKSTKEAINNGAIYGISTEVESYISKLKQEHGKINVILTGGDGEFFGELIDYKIFVDSNLVLKGLNEILNINS